MPHDTIPKQSALGRLERAGFQDWPGLSALKGDEDDRLEVLRPRNASAGGVRSAGSTGWAVGGVLGQLLLKGLGDPLQRHSPFNFLLQTFVPCYVHSITLADVRQTKTLSPSLTGGRLNNRSKHGEKIQSGSHRRAGLGGARARDPFPQQMRAAGAAPPAAPDDPSQLGGCFEPVTRDWLTRSRLAASDSPCPYQPHTPPSYPAKPTKTPPAEPEEDARVASASAARRRLESQPQFPHPPGLLHSGLFLILATTPFRGAISSDQSLPHIHSQFVSPVRVKRLQNPTASHTSTWGQTSCYLCGDDCNNHLNGRFVPSCPCLGLVGDAAATWILWKPTCAPPTPPDLPKAPRSSPKPAAGSGLGVARDGLPHISPLYLLSLEARGSPASAILTTTHQAGTHDDGLLSWLLPPSVGRVFSGSAGCLVFTARPLLIDSPLFLSFPGHLTSYGCVCLLTAL
ncbi:uncharacterized protein LOC117063690 [Trachypithecus francoisi]|uniref:uncharacterized protein LOC117063690 n=1 Tax=Trachypithecus francoisi TaxID=54180 RepID=UPI00141AA882|nr:uncharacterized protein LOC117063690 [Trachypithecus francoisi]